MRTLLPEVLPLRSIVPLDELKVQRRDGLVARIPHEKRYEVLVLVFPNTLWKHYTDLDNAGESLNGSGLLHSGSKRGTKIRAEVIKLKHSRLYIPCVGIVMQA